MTYLHELGVQFPQFVNPKAPFFLTLHGAGVEKTDVHAAVKHIFGPTATSSCPAANKIGQRCVRVSGAQLLARAGFDVQLIKLFGRWGSSSVERYIQEPYWHVRSTSPGQYCSTFDNHYVWITLEHRSPKSSRHWRTSHIPEPSPT